MGYLSHLNHTHPSHSETSRLLTSSLSRITIKFFFWVLIDLIVDLLGLIIESFDNQTERWNHTKGWKRDQKGPKKKIQFFFTTRDLVKWIHCTSATSLHQTHTVSDAQVSCVHPLQWTIATESVHNPGHRTPPRTRSWEPTVIPSPPVVWYLVPVEQWTGLPSRQLPSSVNNQEHPTSYHVTHRVYPHSCDMWSISLGLYQGPCPEQTCLRLLCEFWPVRTTPSSPAHLVYLDSQ